MPKLRWLLMAGHVPPEMTGGGIVRYTMELAKSLAKHDQVQLHVTASRSAAGALADFLGPTSRIIVQPEFVGPGVSLWERLRMGRWIGDRFDVVQGVKHLLPRGVNAHTVLTVHDMLLFDRGTDYPIPKRLLLRAPYKASLRQADQLICVSEATETRLRAILPHLRAKIGVVHSATGSALLQATPVPVDGLHGQPFGLVVGDSSPRKNLATVIAAWREATAEAPRPPLVIVGPPAWGSAAFGSDFPEMVRTGRVRQLVGVSDGHLRWLYEQCSVVLAPSVMEGFGLPAVEALDFGASLITSDDPALVEVSGDAAIHIPALDVGAWRTAIHGHLHAVNVRTTTSRRHRSWADVADETVAQVLDSTGRSDFDM